MACLNRALHTFDGKVTFSAIMVDALIIKAGHKADLLHLDETKCSIRFTRGDSKNDKDYQPLVYEYTIKQAEKAGYMKKNNWQTSPKDMLYSRCLTGVESTRLRCLSVSWGAIGRDDSDGNTTPLLPPIVATQTTNLLPSPANSVEPPKQLGHVKAPNFDEFVKLNGLIRTG